MSAGKLFENAIISEENRKRAFLEELTEISIRHGLYIWGCGCCGSPRLNEITVAGRYNINPSGDCEVDWEVE